MTDHELHAAANTLAAEINGAVATLAAQIAAADNGADLVARGKTLAAEKDRRERAGVRVRASADDLGERTLAHSGEIVAHLAAQSTRNGASVVTLAALLGRAVAMITQMGDALTATERVADAKRLADDEALAVWSRNNAADMRDRQATQLANDRALAMAARVTP